MANRKLPFGYCLRDGQVREETTEAEMVRLIFRRYGEGASYGKLADELNATGCPYAPGRPWNKNMVARVLQDGRYIGGAHTRKSSPPSPSNRLRRQSRTCPAGRTTRRSRTSAS